MRYPTSSIPLSRFFVGEDPSHGLQQPDATPKRTAHGTPRVFLRKRAVPHPQKNGSSTKSGTHGLWNRFAAHESTTIKSASQN